MNECCKCGFHDEDVGCTCFSTDKWYACPIEYNKPENWRVLKTYKKGVIKMTDDHKYYDTTYNLFHNQHIDDITLNTAMEIPEFEAVFANAEQGDYFNQILHMAIHMHYVLSKIESAMELR